MRALVFKFFNTAVGLIPAPILRRVLRALFYNPEIADRCGYTVYPRVYYNPLPDPKEVDFEKMKLKRDVPGIRFNFDECKRLMEDFVQFAPEVREFLRNRPAENLNHWKLTYTDYDSAVLYSMLRLKKPRRYVEVGCGWSTRCSSAAIERNRAEGHDCQSTFIEPFPGPQLDRAGLPGKFIKEKIERVPLELFLQLEAGDVLFIDTSHVLKIQNDVEWELVHILPSLKAGVTVHIHDIFTPYEYPVEWTVGPQRGGSNEQYALECLMSGGGDWEVILPNYLLWKEQRQIFAKLLDEPGPGQTFTNAFWIRKVRQTIPQNHA